MEEVFKTVAVKELQLGGGGSGNNAIVIYNSASDTIGKLRINTNDASLYLGTGNPNANSLVQFDSTTKGFVVPRMTTAQATTLSNASVMSGSIIWDAQAMRLKVFSGAAGLGGHWVAITGTVA